MKSVVHRDRFLFWSEEWGGVHVWNIVDHTATGAAAATDGSPNDGLRERNSCHK